MIASAATIAMLGVSIYWTLDRERLFIENPDESRAFVEGPVHPGGSITVHRSLIRTSDCGIRAGVWISSEDHGLIGPIVAFVSEAPRSSTYVDSRLTYSLPSWVPPGRYSIRQYSTCQRNPLIEVSDQLRDLPFEVTK